MIGPGRVALSEWTAYFRAIRDTKVAPDPMLGFHTTHHIPYHSMIRAAPFSLTLSVSYVNRAVSHFCQLWPYGRMGSFVMRLHQDCNDMGDAPNTSHSVTSFCTQHPSLTIHLLYLIRRCQINQAINNSPLVTSVFCLSTSSYPLSYVYAAYNVFHTERCQSNRCRCIGHFFPFWDGMQVIRVFWNCCACQG